MMMSRIVWIRHLKYLKNQKKLLKIYKYTGNMLSTEKTNRILSVLTILFTLSIPATVIGAIYGMNVHLPGRIIFLACVIRLREVSIDIARVIIPKFGDYESDVKYFIPRFVKIQKGGLVPQDMPLQSFFQQALL
jgi:CorA-like Mg2+ transporter protein